MVDKDNICFLTFIMQKNNNNKGTLNIVIIFHPSIKIIKGRYPILINFIPETGCSLIF